LLKEFLVPHDVDLIILLVIALALCIGTAVVVKVVSHFSAAREGASISSEKPVKLPEVNNYGY
jgi:hypothetical protein